MLSIILVTIIVSGYINSCYGHPHLYHKNTSLSCSIGEFLQYFSQGSEGKNQPQGVAVWINSFFSDFTITLRNVTIPFFEALSLSLYERNVFYIHITINAP